MKIFIGPSGCDLVLEALKKLHKETKSEARSAYFACTDDDFFYINEMARKERNLRSLIGAYEALKNSYTDEGLKEKLLWMTKEE
jgi:hypothetical protein